LNSSIDSERAASCRPRVRLQARGEPESTPLAASARRLRKIEPAVLAFVIATISFFAPGNAQEERKTKVPGLDKITSGPSRQAFSGTVQSLDLKRKLLNVNTVQGGNTEVFPVTKGVRVALANGAKIKLTELTPGATVIVYFEQSGDRRKVKEIIVLAAAPAGAKKPEKPS